MICVKCGRKCQDGRFCSFCGARQPDQESLYDEILQSDEDLQYDENLETDEDLQSDEDWQWDREPQWKTIDSDEDWYDSSDNKFRLAAYIGIGVLIVGILVLLGAILMGAIGGKKDDGDQAGEVVTTEAREEESEVRTTEEWEEDTEAVTTEAPEDEWENQEEDWENEEEESQEEETQAPATTTQEKKTTESSAGIVFPDSSNTVISRDRIRALSDSELKSAINEIYARNGYIFSTDALQKYYEQYDWYHGKADADHFSEDVFNSVEQENLANMIEERSRRN